MAQLPKGGLVRDHDKPIHGSCAIYFPGGIYTKNTFYLGLCEGKTDCRQQFIEVGDQWNANMFFLAEGLSFEFWDNFLLQFVCCISGNSELHSNQLPRERLSCFPHLANRTWKKHGKTIMLSCSRDPSSCLSRICVCILIFTVYINICMFVSYITDSIWTFKRPTARRYSR